MLLQKAHDTTRRSEDNPKDNRRNMERPHLVKGELMFDETWDDILQTADDPKEHAQQ